MMNITNENSQISVLLSYLLEIIYFALTYCFLISYLISKLLSLGTSSPTITLLVVIGKEG